MFIEIKRSKGDYMIVNLTKILLCTENKGKMTIELEDGTPIDTPYSFDELVAIFHSSGVAYAIQERRS